VVGPVDVSAGVIRRRQIKRVAGIAPLKIVQAAEGEGPVIRSERESIPTGCKTA